MAHELLGVDLDLIADRSAHRLIAKYLSKYVAKVDPEHGSSDNRKIGRWWGKWNTEEEDQIELEVDGWLADGLVDFCLASGRGDTSWEPLDRERCTIFGNYMGSGFYRDAVIARIEAMRRDGHI
jgi:hypothetical protein